MAVLTPECFEKQMNTLSDPVFADEATKPQKRGKEKMKKKFWAS